MPNHLVVVNSGSLEMVTLLFNEWVLHKLHIHLYQNQVNIALTSVAADFTECDFDGYPGSQPINWSAITPLDPSNHALLTADPIVYRCTGDTRPQRAYGYYVLDKTDTTLLWAEQFPKRVYFRFGSEVQVVTPKFGLLTEFQG